jgi:hypothetical protein
MMGNIPQNRTDKYLSYAPTLQKFKEQNCNQLKINL